METYGTSGKVGITPYSEIASKFQKLLPAR